MQIILAHVGARIPGGKEFHTLTALYLKRASAFIPTDSMAFRSEPELLDWLDRKPVRPPPAVLLDARGKEIASEAFAAWIGERRDGGERQILFAIGPASGWSDAARRRAQLLLSLGPLTMAHALARLVLAEQIYRACTILVGHPYHTGH